MSFAELLDPTPATPVVPNPHTTRAARLWGGHIFVGGSAVRLGDRWFVANLGRSKSWVPLAQHECVLQIGFGGVRRPVVVETTEEFDTLVADDAQLADLERNGHDGVLCFPGPDTWMVLLFQDSFYRPTEQMTYAALLDAAYPRFDTTQRDARVLQCPAYHSDAYWLNEYWRDRYLDMLKADYRAGGRTLDLSGLPSADLDTDACGAVLAFAARLVGKDGILDPADAAWSRIPVPDDTDLDTVRGLWCNAIEAANQCSRVLAVVHKDIRQAEQFLAEFDP